jgi:hypothetical protein
MHQVQRLVGIRDGKKYKAERPPERMHASLTVCGALQQMCGNVFISGRWSFADV